MKSFEVSGTFKIGDDWKPYTKVIPARLYGKKESGGKEPGTRESVCGIWQQAPPKKKVYHCSVREDDQW